MTNEQELPGMWDSADLGGGETDRPEPGETVRLRVVDPWVTSLTLLTEHGGTLVITKKGTDVPREDVDHVFSVAVRNGTRVALVEDEEQE